MDYFGSKTQKLLNAPFPDSRLDSMTRKCVRTYTPIEYFKLMKMLGNLGAYEILYFLP